MNDNNCCNARFRLNMRESTFGIVEQIPRCISSNRSIIFSCVASHTHVLSHLIWRVNNVPLLLPSTLYLSFHRRNCYPSALAVTMQIAIRSCSPHNAAIHPSVLMRICMYNGQNDYYEWVTNIFMLLLLLNISRSRQGIFFIIIFFSSHPLLE